MLSRKRRWPSAKRMSKASVDLPEPLRPVTMTIRPRGRSSERFLRLCSRAPRTRMDGAAVGARRPSGFARGHFEGAQSAGGRVAVAEDIRGLLDGDAVVGKHFFVARAVEQRTQVVTRV